MGDANKYIHSKGVKEWCTQLRIKELKSERHRRTGPATTRGRKNREAIDRIWGTPGIRILEG
eukprot:12148560-Ditylum_brightwellii.AAC.1